jgi:malic enzyme-like protein
MNEKIPSNGNVRTPSVPAVLNDPMRNRGVPRCGARGSRPGRPIAGGGTDAGAAGAARRRPVASAGGDLAKNVYLERSECRPRPGTAGVGIADQIHDAMVRDGASAEQARTQVWLVDKQGLLTDDMIDLRDYQQPYARDPAEVKGWPAGTGPITLLDTVRHVQPTILLGTSTAHGAFTREVIEVMSAGVDRPIVFPISNPTSRIEAMPADVIAWSKGKALVATGIPVPPVDYKVSPIGSGRPTTHCSVRAWASAPSCREPQR